MLLFFADYGYIKFIENQKFYTTSISKVVYLSIMTALLFYQEICYGKVKNPSKGKLSHNARPAA